MREGREARVPGSCGSGQGFGRRPLEGRCWREPGEAGRGTLPQVRRCYL